MILCGILELGHKNKNMNDTNIKEKNEGMTGTITVNRYRAGTLDKYLELTLSGKNAEAEIVLRDGWLGVACRQHNLIVSSSGYGKNIIARRLASDNTYTGNVTHGEIGTGTNAPALTDIGLQTGTVRVAFQTTTISNNIATIRFFLSDATLPNGTYTEFGTFIDGTATLGTGQLFNRALFSGAGYAKATGEDTTIDVEFDIN